MYIKYNTNSMIISPLPSICHLLKTFYYWEKLKFIIINKKQSMKRFEDKNHVF